MRRRVELHSQGHSLTASRRNLNAAREGFEPSTIALTGRCTAVVLPGKDGSGSTGCSVSFLAHAQQTPINTDPYPEIAGCSQARDEGFEPPRQGPKPCVLPLHQSRKKKERWRGNAHHTIPRSF